MSGRDFFLLASRIPPKLMLVIVTGLALASTILVQSELSRKDQALKDQQIKANQKETGPMLVAAREIPEGATISAESLEVKQVDLRNIPVGALTDTGAAVGLMARMPIHAGDSLLSQSVKYPEQAKGFEAKIKAGYRAITFPVDASTGVAGFITPDSHVDILAQIGSGAESTATPILSDVQVVAVGTVYKKVPGIEEAQPTSSVTVAVQPVDAGKLINAMAAGKLYCLMRSQNDHSPLAVKDVSKIMPSSRAKSENYSELTVMPQIPSSLPPAPPPVLEPVQEATQASPYNVDAWSANKKENVSFPSK